MPQNNESDVLKQPNTRKIFKEMWTNYPISRIEISRSTHLNKATVTQIVKEMQAGNMIVDVGQQDNRIGRTSNLIMLNKYWGLCGCIVVRPRSITIAISDLYANTIWERTTEINWNSQPFDLLGSAARTFQEGLEANRHLSENLLGVGVSFPSIVRQETGEVYDFHSSLWDNIPAREYLQQRLGVPVYVDSFTNNVMLAEYWFGEAKYFSHSILLNISYGIGASIVINGRIYHGGNGFAGNAAHAAFGTGGGLCSCGNHGCWETTGSLLALGKDKVEDVVAAAENGDGIAIKRLDAIGRSIGMGIANLVNLLNPQCVILNGDILLCGSWVLDPCVAVLQEHLPPHLYKSFQLKISRLGSQAITKGAFSSVIQPLFLPK